MVNVVVGGLRTWYNVLPDIAGHGPRETPNVELIFHCRSRFLFGHNVQRR